MSKNQLIEVRDLKKHFEQSTSIIDLFLRRNQSQVQAVDGVSLTFGRGEVHGLIGESGCGKSTLAKVLIGLLSPTGGEIQYKGRATSEFSESDWKEFRRNAQMIFQDPFNSLNPKMTVEESIREILNIHNVNNTDERINKALHQAELNPAEQYLNYLPKELSGGEKQRVSIARALSINPEFLLADEPVSMLDVSTQASILNLLDDLKSEFNLTILYVSHDISTVASLCDKVHVMYLGRIVESGTTREIIKNPKHPYTRALINAVPRTNPHLDRERTNIDGSPREPIDIGDGCRFRDRCPKRMDICDVTPAFKSVNGDHYTACHLYYDHKAEAADSGATKKGQE